MAFFIKAKTASDAWPRILRLIMDKGEARTKDEWGSDTKEILNLLVTITEPMRDPIPNGFPWKKERLEEYARKEFLSAEKGEFKYTYGERLLNYEGINQVEEAISRLKKSRCTRRAVSISWNPKTDIHSEEVPCLLLWDWKIREEKLYQTTVIRSNDMYGAWPANFFGLLKLAEKIAGETNAQIGEISTLSISAHIYSRDFDFVNKILGR